MLLWCMKMAKRLNTSAAARQLLTRYENHKRLSKAEAARIALALKNSGVQNANSRLAAGFARLVLGEIVK